MTTDNLDSDSKFGKGLEAPFRPPTLVTAEEVLAAQKHSLELIVQGAPVDEVLAELTHVVENSAGGNAIAVILILDSAGRFRTAAAPTMPVAFHRAIDDMNALDLGTFGIAAATGVTAVTQDISSDPNWGSIKHLTEQLGLRAAWSHPIVTRDKRVLGAFGTFFRERRRPSAFEVRLVETLSQTAALALARSEHEGTLARQRRTLDLAMEAAQMGSWRYTVADNICMYDERAQNLYGLTDGRFLHDDAGVKNMIHADDLARMWAAVKVAVDPLGEGRYDVEYRVRQPDGTWRWLSAWGIVEFEGEGASRRPIAIAGASRDISGVKRAEERQRLLINELNHRVKNMLATVQSVAYQTMKNTDDPQAMRQVFDARLMSLARAHDLLTHHHWAGADVAAVVEKALEPFMSPRIDIKGAPVDISPSQALALSMALHELATNAVKHGSLSLPMGRVQIAWRVEENAFKFTWREVAGPPVQPPTRRGFGTRLLEQGVAADLGGTAKISYSPEGVAWQAISPLTAIERLV